MDLLFDFSAVARSNEAVRVNSFFTLDITANWDVLRYTPASNRLVCIKCNFVLKKITYFDVATLP